VINLTYDELLREADSLGLVVREKSLWSSNGRLKGSKIAIRKDIATLKEKACVLAEEIAHVELSVGNIIDQNIVSNRKQEYKARVLAYDKMVGLNGIIEACEAGCTSFYMTADYLGVTEVFLMEALESYRMKYGLCTRFDNNIIYFEPSLGVMRLYK